MEQQKKNMVALPKKERTEPEGKKPTNMDELFVNLVRDEMRAYENRRKEAAAEIAKKGMHFRRGAYERILWKPEYIAEQYKLMLEKKCQEPATVRRLISVIGSAAHYRLHRLIEDYKKREAEQKESKDENKQ